MKLANNKNIPSSENTGVLCQSSSDNEESCFQFIGFENIKKKTLLDECITELEENDGEVKQHKFPGIDPSSDLIQTLLLKHKQLQNKNTALEPNEVITPECALSKDMEHGIPASYQEVEKMSTECESRNMSITTELNSCHENDQSQNGDSFLQANESDSTDFIHTEVPYLPSSMQENNDTSTKGSVNNVADVCQLQCISPKELLTATLFQPKNNSIKSSVETTKFQVREEFMDEQADAEIVQLSSHQSEIEKSPTCTGIKDGNNFFNKDNKIGISASNENNSLNKSCELNKNKSPKLRRKRGRPKKQKECVQLNFEENRKLEPNMHLFRKHETSRNESLTCISQYSEKELFYIKSSEEKYELNARNIEDLNSANLSNSSLEPPQEDNHCRKFIESRIKKIPKRNMICKNKPITRFAVIASQSAISNHDVSSENIYKSHKTYEKGNTYLPINSFKNTEVCLNKSNAEPELLTKNSHRRTNNPFQLSKKLLHVKKKLVKALDNWSLPQLKLLLSVIDKIREKRKSTEKNGGIQSSPYSRYEMPDLHAQRILDSYISDSDCSSCDNELLSSKTFTNNEGTKHLINSKFSQQRKRSKKPFNKLLTYTSCELQKMPCIEENCLKALKFPNIQNSTRMHEHSSFEDSDKTVLLPDYLNHQAASGKLFIKTSDEIMSMENYSLSRAASVSSKIRCTRNYKMCNTGKSLSSIGINSFAPVLSHPNKNEAAKVNQVHFRVVPNIFDSVGSSSNKQIIEQDSSNCVLNKRCVVPTKVSNLDKKRKVTMRKSQRKTAGKHSKFHQSPFSWG